MTIRQKLILTIPLAIALAAGGVAWWSGSKGTPQASDSIVEDVVPARNSKVPQQSEVAIDLIPNWRAELTVNGVPIPVDQMSVIEAQSRFGYQPGVGKEIEALQPGQNCAVATYWPIANPEQRFTRSWCFSVV